MARIAEKNKRFRTKEKIAEDLAFILNADISYGTKYAVVSEITWVWSEFYGKHKGCPWRSTESLSENVLKNLIHEHVVPKQIIIERLLGMVGASPKNIYDYLDEHCIGVLITKEENKKLDNAKLKSCMPAGWDGKDVWARYKAVGIEAQQ